MPNKRVKWVATFLLLDKAAALLRWALSPVSNITKVVVSHKIKSIWLRFRSAWLRLPRIRRRLYGNLMIGMVIALLLHYLHQIQSHWLLEYEDAGMDWMMQMYQGTSPLNPSVPLAWIDIDEHTYRAWGEPLYTPRDKLLMLIQYAVSSDAAAIVVDVDLSRRSDEVQADEVLINFLEGYSSTQGPPIVLTRTFRSSPEPGKRNCLQIRSTILESGGKILDSDNLFWASSLFSRDRDLFIRRWRLWEPACTEEGKPDVVPSIQLLITALVRDSNGQSEDIADMLEEKLHSLAPRNCDVIAVKNDDHLCNTFTSNQPDIDVAGMRLAVAPSHTQQRLIYSMPWSHEHTSTVPNVMSTRGVIEPLLVKHTAYPITEGGRPLDTDWMSGRVVLIGGSFEESRDIHATPLGVQPGAMILINAIHSLSQHGQIKSPTLLEKLLIETVLIVFMSYVFARFNSFWGMLISGAFVVLLLLPLSFWRFKYGIWLDFAIPLVAVQLHQMAAEFEEAKHELKAVKASSCDK